VVGIEGNRNRVDAGEVLVLVEHVGSLGREAGGQLVEAAQSEAVVVVVGSGARNDDGEVDVAGEGAREAVAGDAEAAIDERWEFPAEFEDTEAFHERRGPQVGRVVWKRATPRRGLESG
jgi:hypothetical protein